MKSLEFHDSKLDWSQGNYIMDQLVKHMSDDVLMYTYVPFRDLDNFYWNNIHYPLSIAIKKRWRK